MAAPPGAEPPPPAGPAIGQARSSPGRRHGTSEGQRIVQELDIQEMDTQELDTWDEGALSGRHRAPAPAARRASLRLAVAAVSVLVATGLGAVTADVVGLTDSGGSSQGAPPQPIAQDREDEPGPGRTTDLSAAQQLLPPVPDAAPAAPSPELRPQAPADAAASAPDADPSPASVVTVRKGNSCPEVGQTGVTERGEAAVCTASPGKGPDKWRVA